MAVTDKPYSEASSPTVKLPLPGKGEIYVLHGPRSGHAGLVYVHVDCYIQMND